MRVLNVVLLHPIFEGSDDRPKFILLVFFLLNCSLFDASARYADKRGMSRAPTVRLPGQHLRAIHLIMTCGPGL
jgi:hypothetical protein